jgi:hypothetical protein
MNHSHSNTRIPHFRCFLVALALSLACGCISVKPIYNDKEQAKAERAVAEFHKLHNEGKYEELYKLFDEEAQRSMKKDDVLLTARQTFDKWGKVQSASLNQAKVFPTPVIQVRMIYHVKFEKGDAQEWFTWAIRGDEARLIQYQNFPGFGTSDSKK